MAMEAALWQKSSVDRQSLPWARKGEADNLLLLSLLNRSAASGALQNAIDFHLDLKTGHVVGSRSSDSSAATRRNVFSSSVRRQLAGTHYSIRAPLLCDQRFNFETQSSKPAAATVLA